MQLRLSLSQEVQDIKTVFEEQLEASEQNLYPHLEKHFPLTVDTNAASGEFVYFSENALADAEWKRLLELFAGHCSLIGGRHRIRTLLGHPGALTYTRRQQIQGTVRRGEDGDGHVLQFQKVEKDILWVLGLEGRVDYPLNQVYPTIPVVRRINNHGVGLGALHMYKIVGAPLMQLAMPLVSLMAPYFLLRRQLGAMLSMRSYFRMLWLIVKMSFKQLGRQLRTRYGLKTLSSVVSVIVYVLMYLYGVVNTVELSLTTVRAIRRLKKRAARIRAFVRSVPSLQSLALCDGWNLWTGAEGETDKEEVVAGWYRLQDSARADTDMVFLFKLIKNYRTLACIADRLYALDAVDAVRKLAGGKGWCFAETAVSLAAPPVEFVGMAHPLLDAKSRTRNPAKLDRNIVVTGPNAAGKSTYMRAVLINTILGITLGICCAKRAVLGPVQAIHTQMRLVDVAGNNSLFEAEVKSCKALLEGVTRSRPWSLVFLDEPMHSTNALEGASALRGLMERMHQLAGVRCMVTTHYHSVGDLDCVRPVSMPAIEGEGEGFHFPYRLQKGVSRQSIALELLRRAIDDPFIELAIKHKDAELAKRV